MALSANAPRTYEAQEEPSFNDLQQKGSTTIYEGAAVGDSSRYDRGLVAGDQFQGFADRQSVNSGADGTVNVRVRQRGVIQLAVTGVTAVTDEGSSVYASADGTFTLTASGNSAVGKIKRWVTSTTCLVYFEAASVRSI